MSDALRPLGLYEDRYRGDPIDEGSFLIYCHAGEDVIRMEPLGYAANHEILRDQILSNGGAKVGKPIAGGKFSLATFDFRVTWSLDVLEIPNLFVRLHATLKDDERDAFDRYLDAAILLKGQPSPWGSIRDILARHTLPPS